MVFALEKGIDSPNAEQLALINKYRPTGSPEYEASEIQVVTVRASHNLLHKDLKAWTPQSLLNMKVQYPGGSSFLDHSWYDSDDSVGFVFDSMLIHRPDPDPACNLFPDLNQLITRKYGFYELYLQIAIQSGLSIEQGIRYRRIKQVSTGGLDGGFSICPLCETSFDHEGCDHIPPTWYVRHLRDSGELTDAQKSRIAPFIYRSVQWLTEEISFVPVANLTGCEVI